MSDQCSILKIALQDGPEAECRAILSSVTTAHVAGLPLQYGEEHTVVALQKLPARIQKHFGDVPHVVIQPKLHAHSSGSLAAPKVEHIAFLEAPMLTQALVVVWYEPGAEPLLSPENQKQIEQLDWKSLAKKV